MSFHAQRQRLEAAQREKAVERADDAADGVLQIGQAFRQRRMARLAADNHRPADHVRMSVQILGRRVHDDVEAELERSLDPRAGKRIVGDRDQIALAGDLRDRGQIDQLEQGIARRLDPDHPGIGADRRAQPLRIGHVDEADAQVGRALAHVLEQPVSPAVQIVAGDDVRARVQRVDQRRHARQPRGEGEPARAVLEAGDACFQRGPRRVAGARVVVALVHAGAGLHVGRSRVNRRHDRAGRWIGLLTGVNRARGESLYRRGGGLDGRIVHGRLLLRCVSRS